MSVEVDAEDSHGEIMSATYRALCKHGYAHLTMQDIADEFDKSRSLLHYHYDTKEELMLAFVENMIGWVADRLAESDTDAPLPSFEEYVDKFVIEPGEEQRETFALALLELRVQAAHNEAFREPLAEHYAQNVDTVAAILADGVADGTFREVDTQRVGENVYTSLVGARMYQVTMGAERASLRMRDAIADYVERALLREGQVAPYAGGDFSKTD